MSNYNLALPPMELKEAILRCMKAKLVPIVRSAPAIGKSDIIRSIAKENGLMLLDFRLGQADLTDLNGLPAFVDGKATFMPFDDFPLETDEVPTGFNGWLMFFDELTTAHRDIQAAAYKVLLERMIGKHNLHKRLWMVAAGNNTSDNAVAYEMSTALQSRLIHLDLQINVPQWIQWAINNGIDSRILAFIEWKNEALYRFDPNHTDHTYAAPRTWEFVSRLIHKQDVSMQDLPLIAGAIGPGTASEFLTFTEVYSKLPKISDIEKDPASAAVPDELSMRYAMAIHLGEGATSKNLSSIIKYMDRLPIEISVVFMRIINGRNKDMMREKAMQELHLKLMPMM